MHQVVLLRGINLGSHNRIAMPELRETLAAAGYDEVATYVQSGNVVVRSDAAPAQLAAAVKQLIAERFGFDVDVLVRTRDELAQVVDRDPLGNVADNPKRYQVSFLAEQPAAELVDALSKLVAPSERFVAIGRELYAWHPEGVARSKLWNALASKRLRVAATARNWTTVTKLLEMANG